MNKVIGVGVITILISFFGFIVLSNKQTASESSRSTIPDSTENAISTVTDIQASFAIFTNGTFRVFTASMYHNLAEDIYIESSNPNIVNIKKTEVTWNDFFSTLPFKLTSECLTTGTKETFCTGQSDSLRFYLNGNLDQDALNKEINAGDQLLVTFGKDDAKQAQEQIQLLRKL